LEFGRSIRRVLVALAPSRDSGGAACKYCSAGSLDGNRNVVQSNVLNDKLSGASGTRSLSPGLCYVNADVLNEGRRSLTESTNIGQFVMVLSIMITDATF
jgi:hypothetical protein